ncbi:MAG: YitT family protein [Clostridia bacterium]|nr:YitT family protein [Clostridia bacterium]
MKVTKARKISPLMRYVYLTLGTLILCVGNYFFKFPNNFSFGGVSGLSLVLARIIPSPILTPSTIVFILNNALLVLGFFVLGAGFLSSTLYCSTLLSVVLVVMEKLWPLTAPLTSEPLLELFFAVLLPSFGSAVMFHLDASSGGTDIIAMILRKYTSLNTGSALALADAAVAISALFVFGVEGGLFSIFGLILKSVMIDFVTDSFRTKKCFQIITTNPDPVVDFIVNRLRRGATLEEVTGAYNHDRKTMVITVLSRSQAMALRRYVRSIDEHAFMIITTSTEIFGKGFLAD